MGSGGKPKNNGVELCLNAIYVIVLICSYILITKMFENICNQNNEITNFRTAYVNCLILVVPCVLDGVKELLDYNKKQKLYVNILDLVFGTLSFLIAACLVFAIITDNNNVTFAQIVIYGSIVCMCSYATHLTSALIDACKLKFSKGE